MSRIRSRGRVGPAAPSVAVPSVAHRRLPTVGFGEAALVWSCTDCPAWGTLDPLPPRCPDCDGETVVVTED
jgi:hypothetical protein